MYSLSGELRRTPTPKLQRAVLLLAVLCCCSVSLYAQSGEQVVLFTGHLNADCIPDTVKGRSTGLRAYLPDMIVWGRPADKNGCPDTIQGRHAPGTPFVPLTPIIYSGWGDFGGSVAFQRYNQNDSLDDMIFYLWGNYQDSSGVRDTARAVVIFGQKDLDLQHSITVLNIQAPFQASPFIAMDLRILHELVDPAERDLTGEISYELLPANVQVMPPDTTPPHPIAQPADTLLTNVRVYPNPTELWARLQAQPLSPGEYTVSIMAVNGEEYHKQIVQIGESGQLEREFDLRTLPSGYYVVRLHTKGRFIGSYPITIVR